MPAEERPRVLCVDDDASVLEALGRNLRRHFRVETATDPLAAVQVVQSAERFAVVVSDMRMPGMDGAEFLARVREVSPDTIRILLTGFADVESAIAAVNHGQVFRFLTKPCDAQTLTSTLAQAAEQYRLITTERVLLEQTLRGSVEALTNILALVHPLAFGRAMRATKHIRDLLDHFKVSERWAIEVAAMLSQIGCVVLPPQAVEALYNGGELTAAERAMAERMPATLEELLGCIPRLEPVRAILRLAGRNHQELAASGATPASVLWGASALKIVLDHDQLECRHTGTDDALKTMRGRRGCYDPVIFEAFASLQGSGERGEIREVAVGEIQL